MRIAIIGTGLIGGSIGLALRERSPESRVVAFDVDPARADEAVERGAATERAGDITEAVHEADLVVLAVPVGAAIEVLTALAGASGAPVVTDVGSTKLRVVVEGDRLFGSPSRFVGGHPMAGSEDSGIASARPDLFEGAWWILTPSESTDERAYETVRRFVATLGARPTSLPADRHDELVATLSHLPQLVATSLVVAATEAAGEGESLLSLAGPAFRDATRVAASDPALWLDILGENRDAVERSTRHFVSILETLEHAVRSGARPDARRLLERGRAARRTIPAKAAATEAHGLSLPIPDRPGVLAEVTGVFARAGINIEDLAIVHDQTGGRGRLTVLVADPPAQERAIMLLREHGFEAKEIDS